MIDINPDVSMDDDKPNTMLALTAKIVAAYLSKNATPGSELPALIDKVFQSLSGVTTGGVAAPEAVPTPAVPVKKSVFADYIVCLEDGKKLKMLKRHLMTSYGLTPDAYRERWKLPSDYPMVAPAYADKRSVLAKSAGLGRKPTGAMAAVSEPELASTPEPASVPEHASVPNEQHVTPIPKTRGRKVTKAAAADEE